VSEFKFSCPACGRDILADTAHAGKDVACPICKAIIVVPNPTAGTAGGSAQTNIPPAPPGRAASTVQRTSRLAIASLVCSLLSLITCVGWLPGIICGHLAKSRIRRNPALKGSGLATAGLLIGYLLLASEAGTTAVYVWRFSIAVKQGYENVRQDLATNHVIVTQTQSSTISNGNPEVALVQTGVMAAAHPPPEPVELATVAAVRPQIEPDNSGWTSDISKVSVPGHPVNGKLHGMDFILKTAAFRNGDLRLRSANGLQLDVYRLGVSIEGHSYEIQADDNNRTNPRVKMTWNQGGAVRTATFNKGYEMKLQFNQALNRKVSGRIYLCFPDDSKSCVAGAFEVRLPRPK
jgi:Domain of unknown function (DUF4190)